MLSASKLNMSIRAFFAIVGALATGAAVLGMMYAPQVVEARLSLN
jgi:hypothetical protein